MEDYGGFDYDNELYQREFDEFKTKRAVCQEFS